MEVMGGVVMNGVTTAVGKEARCSARSTSSPFTSCGIPSNESSGGDDNEVVDGYRGQVGVGGGVSGGVG